jgi:hypothetical protein
MIKLQTNKADFHTVLGFYLERKYCGNAATQG